MKDFIYNTCFHLSHGSQHFILQQIYVKTPKPQNLTLHLSPADQCFHLDSQWTLVIALFYLLSIVFSLSKVKKKNTLKFCSQSKSIFFSVHSYHSASLGVGNHNPSIFSVLLPPTDIEKPIKCPRADK